MAVAAGIVNYGSSSGEEEEEEAQVDYSESSNVISSLKEKFSMNSTPAVPNKVMKCRRALIRTPHML